MRSVELVTGAVMAAYVTNLINFGFTRRVGSGSESFRVSAVRFDDKCSEFSIEYDRLNEEKSL